MTVRIEDARIKVVLDLDEARKQAEEFEAEEGEGVGEGGGGKKSPFKKREEERKKKDPPEGSRLNAWFYSSLAGRAAAGLAQSGFGPLFSGAETGISTLAGRGAFARIAGKTLGAAGLAVGAAMVEAQLAPIVKGAASTLADNPPFPAEWTGLNEAWRSSARAIRESPTAQSVGNFLDGAFHQIQRWSRDVQLSIKNFIEPLQVLADLAVIDVVPPAEVARIKKGLALYNESQKTLQMWAAETIRYNVGRNLAATLSRGIHGDAGQGKVGQ
jgi:hypothetical protein